MDNVSSDASSDEDEGTQWKDRLIDSMKKENRDLKRAIEELESTVQRLNQEAEEVRLDVIHRSQKNFECDMDLYKKISDFTKQTLFRHIKFITSDEILNNLESKTSLANVTMDCFDVDARDRISWWRACRIAVSDAIGNHRNQVAQAIKTQVLSK